MSTASPWLPASDMAELRLLMAEAAHSDAAQLEAADDILIAVDGARLARQLRHSGRTVVGLLPTGPDPLIQPLARQIGFALSTLTQTLTLVLDPEQQSGFSPSMASPDSGALVHVQSAAPGVCVLTPFAVAPTGSKFEMVKVLLQFVADRSKAGDTRQGQILVDLSGCTRPGELLGAISLVEGIIVVGRAGRVTEHEIELTMSGLPPELNLGVLLTE